MFIFQRVPSGYISLLRTILFYYKVKVGDKTSQVLCNLSECFDYHKNSL